MSINTVNSGNELRIHEFGFIDKAGGHTHHRRGSNWRDGASPESRFLDDLKRTLQGELELADEEHADTITSYVSRYCKSYEEKFADQPEVQIKLAARLLTIIGKVNHSQARYGLRPHNHVKLISTLMKALGDRYAAASEDSSLALWESETQDIGLEGTLKKGAEGPLTNFVSKVLSELESNSQKSFGTGIPRYLHRFNRALRSEKKLNRLRIELTGQDIEKTLTQQAMSVIRTIADRFPMTPLQVIGATLCAIYQAKYLEGGMGRGVATVHDFVVNDGVSEEEFVAISLKDRSKDLSTILTEWRKQIFEKGVVSIPGAPASAKKHAPNISFSASLMLLLHHIIQNPAEISPVRNQGFINMVRDELTWNLFLNKKPGKPFYLPEKTLEELRKLIKGRQFHRLSSSQKAKLESILGPDGLIAAKNYSNAEWTYLLAGKAGCSDRELPPSSQEFYSERLEQSLDFLCARLSQDASRIALEWLFKFWPNSVLIKRFTLPKTFDKIAKEQLNRDHERSVQLSPEARKWETIESVFLGGALTHLLPLTFIQLLRARADGPAIGSGRVMFPGNLGPV